MITRRQSSFMSWVIVFLSFSLAVSLLADYADYRLTESAGHAHDSADAVASPEVISIAGRGRQSQ